MSGIAGIAKGIAGNKGPPPPEAKAPQITPMGQDTMKAGIAQGSQQALQGILSSPSLIDPRKRHAGAGMKLDRLREGLLGGPLLPGGVFDARPLPHTVGPPADNVTEAIGNSDARLALELIQEASPSPQYNTGISTTWPWVN